MKYRLPLPSNARTLRDKETGTMLSPRELTSVDPSIQFLASLVSFGNNVDAKHKNKGRIYIRYNKENCGSGYAVVSIEDKIKIIETTTDCVNHNEALLAVDSLILSAQNIGKALGKDLELNDDTDHIEEYARVMNEKYRGQQIEDKFHWKLEPE